jgi:hypothetical protein
MPALFSPCVGAVTKVAACDTSQKLFAISFDYVTKSPGWFWSTPATLTAPITGFALEQNGNYQFLHTVNDFIYVYSFGDRVGELVVSGIGFAATCANASNAKLCNVYDFYRKNKLSTNGRLSVTIGDCPNSTFYAFLTGCRLEMQDPATLIGQWSLRFSVIPKTK